MLPPATAAAVATAAVAGVARGVWRERRRRRALLQHDDGGFVVAPTWTAVKTTRGRPKLSQRAAPAG
jgi:hypothetical protein